MAGLNASSGFRPKKSFDEWKIHPDNLTMTNEQFCWAFHLSLEYTKKKKEKERKKNQTVLHTRDKPFSYEWYIGLQV